MTDDTHIKQKKPEEKYTLHLAMFTVIGYIVIYPEQEFKKVLHKNSKWVILIRFPYLNWWLQYLLPSRAV
jgi:hypothetical protein